MNRTSGICDNRSGLVFKESIFYFKDRIESAFFQGWLFGKITPIEEANTIANTVPSKYNYVV